VLVGNLFRLLRMLDIRLNYPPDNTDSARCDISRNCPKIVRSQYKDKKNKKNKKSGATDKLAEGAERGRGG
jgi:hypothetical protein